PPRPPPPAGAPTPAPPRHSTCTPAASTSASRPWDRKFRSPGNLTRRELARELAGQRLLPGRQARGGRAQHPPGPAFAEADHAELRERPAAALTSRGRH